MKIELNIVLLMDHCYATRVSATYENGEEYIVWVDEMDKNFPLLKWILGNTQQKPEAVTLLPSD